MGITRTVAIVDSDGSRKIVNETEFNPRKHKLFEEATGEDPQGGGDKGDDKKPGGKGK